MPLQEVVFPIIVLLSLGITIAVLSRMTRINPIVGYIAMGALIAAVRPNLVANESLHFLADLGVVFLLFDIGLHFSIAHVRREAKDIFGFGPLQVIGATLIIALVAWFSGLPVNAALLVGTTLALSSTAVVVSVIAERRQQNCPVALTATAILVFQDVAAILLLVVTASAAGESYSLTLAATIMKALLAIGVTVLIARLVVRPLYALLASHGGEEVFTATALLFALASGYAATAIGLSMTLGAFLGGMMLADSPFRASAQGEIGPFRSLLVSFFFISVGASLDLSFIAHGWPLILLLTAALVVLKSIANMGASLAFRWSIPGSVQLGILLAGGSEFAFVIFASPSTRNLLGADVIAFLTVAVTVSLAITPVLAVMGRTIAGRLRLRATDRAVHELIPHGRTNPVLLIGMGEVGRTIADGLVEFSIGYDAIERDEERLRLAVADGYHVTFGDFANARIWRAMDLEGRHFSVMTAASHLAAADWLPSSLALFPKVRRVWITSDINEVHLLSHYAVEPVITKTKPRGIEAARMILQAFEADPAEIEAWATRQATNRALAVAE